MGGLEINLYTRYSRLNSSTQIVNTNLGGSELMQKRREGAIEADTFIRMIFSQYKTQISDRDCGGTRSDLEIKVYIMIGGKLEVLK